MIKSGNFVNEFEIEDCKVKVYNAWILTLMFWSEFYETKSEIKLPEWNPADIQKVYKNGFVEGRNNFNKEYYIKPHQVNDTFIRSILDLRDQVSKSIMSTEAAINDENILKYGINSGKFYEIQKFEEKHKREVERFFSSNESKSNKVRLFKDLFVSDDQYKKVIKILCKNKFIERRGKDLKWIYPRSKKFKSTKQAIIALCVVLERKHYLIEDPKAVYKNIQNEFGIEIPKGNYSRSSNSFMDEYDSPLKTQNFAYLSLFRDIL